LLTSNKPDTSDAWYDNEMGYACRMVDLACHMQAQGI
jgi:glyceraldehyde 3-phosphate dehydrogenase